MLSLNLLPPREKQALASAAAGHKIFAWNISFFLLILAFFVVLLSVWLCVRIQLNSLEAIVRDTESGQEGRAFRSFKDRVLEANNGLKDLNNLQKGLKTYSSSFEALTQLVPSSGLSLSRFSLNSGSLSVEGRADSREVLLLFKDNLEKSAYFEKIENPVSNLLKQNDIDFIIKLQIK